MKSVIEKSLLESFLASFDSSLLNLFTQKECIKHFSLFPIEDSTVGKEFHFYHSDLGLRNIIVLDDESVADALDREIADSRF